MERFKIIKIFIEFNWKNINLWEKIASEVVNSLHARLNASQ